MVDLPTQPTVGIAAVHVRDTEHQQPTQILGQRPNWPTMDQISSVIDAADLKSTTGYFGGSLPDHSQHWTDYLTSMWQVLPTGKVSTFNVTPDPSNIPDIISSDQDAITGNGTDAWFTLRNTFAKMWSKGAAPATYKQSHP